MIEPPDKFPEFNVHMSKLKEISVDTSKPKLEYMTESQILAVSFDKVKEAYVKGLSLKEAPCSNDALLYIKADKSYVFIEFKSGYIDKEKMFSIRKKIYDSALIFTDIIHQGISTMRKKVDYILVINESVNPDEASKLEKNYIQPSPAYENFAKSVTERGNNKYIPYGLKRFQNYCFRNMDVFTKPEFEKYLQKIQH